LLLAEVKLVYHTEALNMFECIVTALKNNNIRYVKKNMCLVSWHTATAVFRDKNFIGKTLACGL
jgi:hypothetical protein